MGWRSLGAVEVGEDWRSFPQLAIAGHSYRFIHQGTLDPTINSCWFAQYYIEPAVEGRLTPIKLIYPSSEPQILALPPPPDLYEKGFFSRSFQVKYRAPYYPTYWVIEIQEFF